MDPASMKVTELKAQLKKRGLAVGGLKKELVDRLNDALAEEAKGSASADEADDKQANTDEPTEQTEEPASDQPAESVTDVPSEKQTVEVPSEEPTKPIEETKPAQQPAPSKDDSPEPADFNPPSSDSTPRLEDITTELPMEEPAPLDLNGTPANEKEVTGDILPEELRAPIATETKEEADKMEVDGQEASKGEGETGKLEVSTAATNGSTTAQTVPAEDTVMADVDTTEKNSDVDISGNDSLKEADVQDAMDTSVDPADVRKRKRRSATPPPPTDKDEPEAKKARQEEPSDDKGAARTELDVTQEREMSRERSRSRSVTPRRRASASNNLKPDPRFRALVQPGSRDDEGKAVGGGSDDEDDSVPPSIHPATRAIYIENLMRPLKEPELTSYLASLATKTNSSPRPDVIQNFYLDTIKTHAFVVFPTIAEATRVRSRLHNRVWPKERDRKPLNVDFFPEELFSKWVDLETGGGASRSRTTKWKVNYTRVEDGNVQAVLEDAAYSSNAGPPPRNAPNFAGGSFAPPTGPRLDRERREFEQRREAPRGEVRVEGGRQVKVVPLEELFLYTKTKPRLYYLPVKDFIARERLERRDEMQKNGRRYGRPN